MDYEKAYKEALERAKDIKNGPCPRDESISTADYIFPELRESEDERIRTCVIGAMKLRKEEDYEFFGSVSIDKVIAWLERQKEQKPAEWNDTDMKEARDNLISVCRDWERGKQTALLPIVAVRARYFLEHLTEPKPAEWSEEDDVMQIRVLGALGKIAVGKRPTGNMEEEIEWAKKLDERFRHHIPQPHWKPSEEQMKALNAMNCCGELSYQGQQQLLIDLYQQLKKLM